MTKRGLKFWPQSLYGQILLVAALALLLAQGINAAMLLSGERARAVIEASTMVVGRVASQGERAREFNLPFDHESTEQPFGPPDGPHASRFRPAGLHLMFGDAPIKADGFAPQHEMEERANEFLLQSNSGLRNATLSLGPISALPATMRMALQRPPRGIRARMQNGKFAREALLFSAQLSDGRWVSAATKVRPNDTGSIVALIVQTLTLYIAVMIPLALVARRIARPLERLKERVQRVGLAEESVPLESEGPQDVRQLVDAFNAMQSRVSSLLSEKDVMLGAIGHDLKTPLAALRVRIESVEDSDDREKMAATVDEMVTILDDILTLARLGKSGEAVQRTHIEVLVQSVCEEFEDAGANVGFDSADARHVVGVRPVLLRRALRNLIGNAVTYGKQARVTLDSAAAHIAIHIDDLGPGIAPDQIDKMFEPFSRTGTDRNRATGGSGLGLTIARAIARAHGGDVRLQNRPEGGLRASLVLPADI